MSLLTLYNAPLGPLPIEGIYPSVDAIHTNLKNLAVANGYNITKRDSQPPGSHPKVVTFAYNKGRNPIDERDPNLHESKRRKFQGSKKINCLFKVKARRCEGEGTIQWQLELTYGDHNHRPHLASTADPANRLVAQPPEVLREINRLRKGGNSPADILSTLRVDRPDISLVPKDIYNLNAKQRLDDLAGKTPIQWLMDVSPIFEKTFPFIFTNKCLRNYKKKASGHDLINIPQPTVLNASFSSILKHLNFTNKTHISSCSTLPTKPTNSICHCLISVQ